MIDFRLPLRLVLAIACGCGGLAALAQDAPPATVDPRGLGIDLSPGPIVGGKGEAIATSDADGRPAIGRLHVRVGDGAVVLLDDGQLVARKAGDFSPTDRPFVPLSKDALAARLAGEFPGFKTRTATATPYVYVYDTSDEFALATSRILESMLSDSKGVKAFADNQKIAVHDPAVPLPVVMFRTEEAFQQHRRMPAGVVAYYDPLSNRVVMYEESRLAGIRPDLAIRQSLATIAHEGVHQILHNIGVQQRLSVWPMWLSEGLAEYLAPTSTGNRLMWKGAGQVNDLRMFELEQYLKSRAAEEPDGQMVEQTVLAGRLSSTGYASAWSLVHYLAKARRVEFAAYLREVGQLGPLEGALESTPPGVIRGNMNLFAKHFGEDRIDLERRLVLHLKKLPYTDPFANAPHFVATFAVDAGRRPQRSAGTFHSPTLAAKWVRDMREKLPADDRDKAASAIRPFANRALAEAFAREWRGR